MRALSCEKGAKEWESNLKSTLQVLSLSRIFDFDGLFFCVDTGHRQVLAISAIKKLSVKVVSSVGSLLQIPDILQ